MPLRSTPVTGASSLLRVGPSSARALVLCVSLFFTWILKVVKQEVIHLVINDTLTLRASKKAPGSQIHHQHGNKPNLAQYVRGQCWVKREKQPVALPSLPAMESEAKAGRP